MAIRPPARIYGSDEVDVAYEPWRALRPTELRVGPSPRAVVVLADDGRRCALREGDHFGRQSTRNPDCSAQPPLRPPANGYVWGYLIRRGFPAKSGWMRLADLVRAPEYAPRTCGPAGADFDRRRPDACGDRCDGRALRQVVRRTGLAEVDAREAYLRYNPRGAAVRYLVEGDDVRRLAAWQDFTAVEVRRGRWAPTGSRGWVISSALRRT